MPEKGAKNLEAQVAGIAGAVEDVEAAEDAAASTACGIAKHQLRRC